MHVHFSVCLSGTHHFKKGINAIICPLNGSSSRPMSPFLSMNPSLETTLPRLAFHPTRFPWLLTWSPFRVRSPLLHCQLLLLLCQLLLRLLLCLFSSRAVARVAYRLSVLSFRCVGFFSAWGVALICFR